MTYFVYMLASQRNGTIYTGVIQNLIKRVYEHKNQLAEGFAKQHNVKRLVYFEIYDALDNVRYRERRFNVGTETGRSN